MTRPDATLLVEELRFMLSRAVAERDAARAERDAEHDTAIDAQEEILVAMTMLGARCEKFHAACARVVAERDAAQAEAAALRQRVEEARQELEAVHPNGQTDAERYALAALSEASPAEAPRCPRCGSAFDGTGACARRAEGCQGGRGEAASPPAVAGIDDPVCMACDEPLTPPFTCCEACGAEHLVSGKDPAR